MTDKEALRLLDELSKSPAWKYLRDVMEQELRVASSNLTSRVSIPPEELHYRRGAIWAGEQLLNLPARLRQNIETQLRIDEAKAREAALLKDAGATTPKTSKHDSGLPPLN